MNFFGKGKKGAKRQQKQQQHQLLEPSFDFSSPDAFSDENLAKMGGVDTIAIDENDPALMAELADLGWGQDDPTGGSKVATATAKPPAGHRPRPDIAPSAAPQTRGRGGTSAPPGRQQQSGNDLLRSLGLSLNSVGDAELTEADLEDPELLGELGEVSGGVSFDDGAPPTRIDTDAIGLGVGKVGAAGGRAGYGDDGDGVGGDGAGDDIGAGVDADDDLVEPDRESEDDVMEPDRELEGEAEIDEDALLELENVQEETLRPAKASKPALPPRRPSPAPAPSSTPGGIPDGEDRGGEGGGGEMSEAERDISQLQQEAEGLRRRALELKKDGDRAGAVEALRAARSAEHELSILKTLEATRKVANVRTEYVTPPSYEEVIGGDEEQRVDQAAPTPAPAGAGAGGGKPVSAELVMKQVEILLSRAVELKKEGRTAEAMACLKRAKSLEADLMRDAHGKGLVDAAGAAAMEDAAEGGRRPGMLRRSSSRRSSSSSAAAAAAAAADPSSRKKDSRAGPHVSLPPSVKAAHKPKVFPAERDLFSDLEDALAAAVQMHVDRAKTLVKKDRAAAAKEVKRYKELQSKLDLAREMRVVPGARPPKWQWKITKKSRVRVLEQVPLDRVELEIYRVHGLTDKTDNKGSIWVKYDLNYAKDDKTGIGYTNSYRADGDTVDIDFKESFYVKRARSTQMSFQNRRAGFEIFHKKNIVSGTKLIGKCLLPLQPLLTTCEMTVSTPILTEARREAGGSLEICLRLRKPMSSDEIVVTEEKELEVGEWPAVSLEPTPQQAPVAPAPAPAAAIPATPR